MMTKPVVSVAAIVGYNRCHTPRHRIKDTLDVSLGYSIFGVSPNLNLTIVMLQTEAGFVSKHNVVRFHCSCPPFFAPLWRKRLWFPVKDKQKPCGHSTLLQRTSKGTRRHRMIRNRLHLWYYGS
ncbi:hypothetical protein TNCV_1683201 [Trichonephila clavipes]|nr:hypothetical protein TNCV_1683201 [Trichonephila clavipes]